MKVTIKNNIKRNSKKVIYIVILAVDWKGYKGRFFYLGSLALVTSIAFL